MAAVVVAEAETAEVAEAAMEAAAAVVATREEIAPPTTVDVATDAAAAVNPLA